MKGMSWSSAGQHIPSIWISMLGERGKREQKHDCVLTGTSTLNPFHTASSAICQKKWQTTLVSLRCWHGRKAMFWHIQTKTKVCDHHGHLCCWFTGSMAKHRQSPSWRPSAQGLWDISRNPRSLVFWAAKSRPVLTRGLAGAACPQVPPGLA